MATTYTYSWPDWMPKPLQQGFTINPVERRKISDMEAGSLIRVEYDNDEMECQCSVVLDQNQAAFFESFEAQVLRQGSRWFEFPLWVSGEIQYQMVRFKARPKISQIRGYHTFYQMTLQVEKRQLMDEGVTAILSLFGPDAFYDFENRLHVIEHEEMPGVTILPLDLPWGLTG